MQGHSIRDKTTVDTDIDINKQINYGRNEKFNVQQIPKIELSSTRKENSTTDSTVFYLHTIQLGWVIG